MRRARWPIRGISPVLATLILIIIAVIAGVLVYAWTMGWIGGQLGGAREELEITGISVSNGFVYITVRNKGTVKSTIDRISIDDQAPQPVGVEVGRGETKTVSVAYAWTYRDVYHVKLWTARGLVLEGDYHVAEPESPYCLSFDGSGDYVEITDPGTGWSLDVDYLTIEVWVKISAHVDWQIVLNKEETYEITSSGSGNTLQYAIWQEGAGGWSWIDTGYVMPTGEWKHIAITYDGSTSKAYVDGDLVHTYNWASSAPIRKTDYALRIGARNAPDPPTYVFNGLIDEVRIYNRALSDNEIRNNYKGSITTDGLVLWLRFDEGSGDVAYDVSGNGNHGTIYGAEWVEPGITREVISSAVLGWHHQLMIGDAMRRAL